MVAVFAHRFPTFPRDLTLFLRVHRCETTLVALPATRSLTALVTAPSALISLVLRLIRHFFTPAV
jgi:hypothetical protein